MADSRNVTTVEGLLNRPRMYSAMVLALLCTMSTLLLACKQTKNVPSNGLGIAAHNVKGTGGVSDAVQSISSPFPLRAYLPFIVPSPKGSSLQGAPIADALQAPTLLSGSTLDAKLTGTPY